MSGTSGSRPSERELQDARIAGWRERLRTSLWLFPAVFVAGAVVLERLAVWVDRNTDDVDVPFIRFISSTDSAQQVLATIATSTLTFMGVVFSITIVALQLASQQFSPRVLRTFLASRITQVALGSFVSTFVYAILVLRQVQPPIEGGEPFVPGVSVFIAVVLVLSTVAIFIVFVHHTVHSVRAVEIIEAVATETRQAIRVGLPPEGGEDGEVVELADHTELAEALGLPPVTGRVKTGGSSQVLAGVEIDRLVALAGANDAVFVLWARVGDFLPSQVPVLSVHGGRVPGTDELQRCFELADERTMFQDVGFGLRQLVDIANKALSPAMNDPTTAGQAIDRLVDLLRAVGRRPDPGNVYRDGGGTLRLVRARSTWDDLVRLAFTEIRHYGAGAIQVARRLTAALDDLESTVHDRYPERVRVLREERELLRRSVERHFPDPEDQALALTPDRLGIG